MAISDTIFAIRSADVYVCRRWPEHRQEDVSEGVDIEDDEINFPRQAGDVLVLKHPLDAGDILRADEILESRKCRLAGQAVLIARSTVTNRFEGAQVQILWCQTPGES